MMNKSKKRLRKPFLLIKNNIITETNKEFENLSGYTKNEIVGKTLANIGEILKINSRLCLMDIENENNNKCFIFTKNLDVREVSISVARNDFENETVYYIKEFNSSRLENRLAFATSIMQNDQIGLAIYSIPHGIVLKVNDVYREYYNIKEKNIIGSTLEELFADYEYKGSNYEDIFWDVVNNCKPKVLKEMRFPHPQKGDLYWDASIVPICINDEAKYLVHFFTDVTEAVIGRKIIEEQKKLLEKQNKEISHQKQELEAILNKMSDALYTVDKDLNVVSLNNVLNDLVYKPKSFKKLFDTSKHTNYYDNYGKEIKFEDFPHFRILNGENINDYVFTSVRPDKTIHLSISGSPIFDENGNVTKALICTRDITGRKINEEYSYLRKQYETFYSIIDNLNLSCTIFSYPEMKITYANHKTKIFLKKKNEHDDYDGKDVFDAYGYNSHEREEVIKNLDAIIEKGTGVYNFIRHLSEDGDDKFVRIIFQPMYGINKQILEVIAVAVNITEEITAQNKLEETMKMQDDVYANITHELKTPLNVIYSANQIMDLYLRMGNLDENSDKLLNYNNNIKQNCYRITKLINNIVDVYRCSIGYQNVNLVNLNIIEVVENIVYSVSEYVKFTKLKIIFDTNREEKIIACDPEKIERIMLNLISNAIKFTNPNGEILVNIISKRNNVEIYVRDDGAGIDEKHLDKLFDRFYQVDKSLSRNAEGCGIGLSLVKCFVELHGGNISVTSKKGRGSTFKIVLPSKTIMDQEIRSQDEFMSSKIENLKIEFSDIYSIN